MDSGLVDFVFDKARPEATPPLPAQPPVRLPPQRQIAYPPDVADKDALRAMLAETDVFGDALEEARA